MPILHLHSTTETWNGNTFSSSDVVKLLLEYGAYVNQTDKAHYKTGLHVACEAQSVACVQYLLDAGADPNVQAEEGRTPLHIGGYECCHVILGTIRNLEGDAEDNQLRLKTEFIVFLKISQFM